MVKLGLDRRVTKVLWGAAGFRLWLA